MSVTHPHPKRVDGAAGRRATLWLETITHMQTGEGQALKIYRPLGERDQGQEALSKGGVQTCPSPLHHQEGALRQSLCLFLFGFWSQGLFTWP